MPSHVCHPSKCTVVVLGHLQPSRTMMVQGRAWGGTGHQQALCSAPPSKCRLSIKDYWGGLFATTGVS